MRLSRHCLGQQCLTCTGRSYQKRPFGQPGSDLGIFAGVVQEVHHFHQRFLGLILPCHILKGDAGLFLHIGLGGTLANAHGAASAAHPPEEQAHQSPHQQDRKHIIEQHRHNNAGTVGGRFVGLDILFQQALGQCVVVFHLTGIVSHRTQTVTVCKRGFRLRLLRVNDNSVGFYRNTLDLFLLDHLDKSIVGNLLIGSTGHHLHEHADA